MHIIKFEYVANGFPLISKLLDTLFSLQSQHNMIRKAYVTPPNQPAL